MVASLDTLAYGVDGLRIALVGVSHFGVALDTIALCIIITALTGAGSYLISRIQL